MSNGFELSLSARRPHTPHNQHQDPLPPIRHHLGLLADKQPPKNKAKKAVEFSPIVGHRHSTALPEPIETRVGTYGRSCLS